MKFKKITAILGSVLMAGMTAGIASAASWTDFAKANAADTAVVYGANANLDLTAATSIKTALSEHMKTTSTIVTGGDSYMMEKTSTKFHVGDSIADVVSVTLDDDELPSLLKDGKFTDDDNDEFDYTQKLTLANLTLNMFEDNDYKSDEPSVGIRIANGAHVMNYTLDFTDEPDWADLETADLPMMGKEYYVLDASATVGESITLLDSATSTILAEDESATIAGKTVSVEFIGSAPEVKLNVDGESTTTLGESQTYKLKDGSYLGVKDILYSSKEGTVSKVEFSIGKGKLLLTDGSDVELNEDSISDLSVHITNSSAKLSSIVLQWNAEDDLFVADDSEIVIPGFESVKMSYGGLEYPAEEEIMVEPNGDEAAELKSFPLKDSTEDIDFLYFDGTNYTMIGKDSDNLLRTSGTTSLTYDGDTDDWFLVSWTDGSDAESYLMKATNFKNESGTQKATFQYRKDGVWTDVKSDAEATDEISVGNVELTVGTLNKAAKTAVVTRGNSNMNFNTLYSKEGMKVYMPWLNTTAMDFYNTTNVSAATACSWLTASSGTQLGYTQVVSYNDTTTNSGTANTTTCTSHPATYSLIFSEEDKNENIGDGDNITLTIGDNTNNEVSVTALTAGGTNTEIKDTDVYRNFAYSALATETMWDKSGDQYKVTLTYHGDEVPASLYVTSAEAKMTSEDSMGKILVTDKEIDSVKDKNLVIVGGSCINTAAAKVLGGAMCGDDFTQKTGVRAGEFLIQGMDGAYSSGKMAIVVAGYSADDTSNGVKYLLNKVDDVSKKYKGTSATEATLQVM